MEKMNIIDILRDCPEGTKLYSPLCGECELHMIDNDTITCSFSENLYHICFDIYGHYKIAAYKNSECLLFPSKENRDWTKFQRPFKDGDIIYNPGIKVTAIFYKQTNDHTISHCFLNILGELKINHYHSKSLLDWRFASEEEKQGLFKVIKDNGYCWSHETKTLEKFKKFKDGDILFVKAAYSWILIYKDSANMEDIYKYAAISTHPNYKFIVYDKNPLCCKEDISEIRLASEKEKERLFKTLDDNGYCWNSKTKTLDPKFKDGDVVFYSNTIAIFKEWGDETLFRTYCTFYTTVSNPIYQFEISRPLNGKGIRREARFATLEEKEKLFEVIRDNGYRWNSETKTLEKLPKFKVGDRVKQMSAHTIGIVVKVDDKGYYVDYPKGNGVRYISFMLEKDYELLPNKFDINTLKPFDKVLVRDTNEYCWHAGFYSHHTGTYFYSTNGLYAQCIPFEENKHLLGTTNECDEYYKNWK